MSTPRNILEIMDRAADYYDEDHAPCHAQDMRAARAAAARVMSEARMALYALEEVAKEKCPATIGALRSALHAAGGVP